jgi:methylase of polypeptide subunit release factors
VRKAAGLRREPFDRLRATAQDRAVLPALREPQGPAVREPFDRLKATPQDRAVPAGEGLREGPFAAGVAARALGSLVREVRSLLTAAGVPEPEIEARLMVQFALGMTTGQLLAGSRGPVPACASELLAAPLARRLKREPLPYITGVREFYGRTFSVDRRVLVPRPESELLVERAVEFAAEVGVGGAPAGRGAGLRIADIGTGSGALAVTLALELPEADVFASDLSGEALEVARENAERLGVARRVRWLQGDLVRPFENPSTGSGRRLRDRPSSRPFESLRDRRVEDFSAAGRPFESLRDRPTSRPFESPSTGSGRRLRDRQTSGPGVRRFDIVVSNPPYVPSADVDSGEPELGYEPRLALEGGPDGLAVIRRLMAALPAILRPGRSVALVEADPRSAGPAADMARRAMPGAHVEVLPDLAGLDRCVEIRLGERA